MGKGRGGGGGGEGGHRSTPRKQNLYVDTELRK
jgi:hypothetical protein